MGVAPGAIEGSPAPVVPEAPKPSAAPVEAKVTGPAAEQADALATAAVSAGSPDKQLGVLAAGAQKVLKFIRGSALSDAQLQNIQDTAPERAALAESLKPPLEKQPMPDGLAPATGPLAKEVAEKAATIVHAEGENPKADGLPDPFDGKSVANEGAPKDTAVPPVSEAVAGDASVSAAGSTAPGEGSAPVEGASTATEAAPVSSKPALGEKALTEINGLLGEGIVTKDSKAEDLMDQLVAKGWKNDADTLSYVQGAIDIARAKTPAEQVDTTADSTGDREGNSTAEASTAPPAENQISSEQNTEITQLKEEIKDLKETVTQLVEANKKLADNQMQEELMRQDQDEKAKMERRKRILKNLADIAKLAIMSAVVDVTQEASGSVTGQQQR